MAVVISAMAPPSLHGSSRLSRASSCAMPPPPPPPALAKKDAQDTLFTDEEFQALMSGQCELLSFSDNHLQSPQLSVQLQAQLLCRDEEDDACARFQEPPPPVAFAMDDDGLDAFSDEEIQQALFYDEEIQALCAAPAPQEASSMQFSGPRSDDHQAGKKRMSSSPPWPSCIADDDDGEDYAGPSPPLALPFPPLPKKARTQTKRRCRLEHGPPALVPPPPPPPTPTKKAARFETKSRTGREHAAAARTARLRQRLRKWHNRIATRVLARQFRPPELSRRRTALRCQCPELALEPRGLDCCALHQEVLPGHRAWMYSADQGHGAPPLVGGPGVVLAPSAGNGKVMLLQYARWRRSVTLPSRFYVQRAVEKRKGLAKQQLEDDLTMLPEY